MEDEGGEGRVVRVAQEAERDEDAVKGVLRGGSNLFLALVRSSSRSLAPTHGISGRPDDPSLGRTIVDSGRPVEATVLFCRPEYTRQLLPYRPDPVLVDPVPELVVVPEMELVLLPPDGRVPARERVECGPGFGVTDRRCEPGFEAVVEGCGSGESGRGRDPILGRGEAEVFGSEAVGRGA